MSDERTTCLACGHGDPHQAEDRCCECQVGWLKCEEPRCPCTFDDRTIAALRAENARLNVECEWAGEERLRLEAEVERLREANESVAVCANHTKAITEMSGLANGCYVCEVEQSMDDAALGAGVRELVATGWTEMYMAPDRMIIVRPFNRISYPADTLDAAVQAAVQKENG